MTAEVIVRAYWDAMATNNFRKAAEWLSEDVLIDWPQSRERIKGRENFVALNHAYPAHGRWTFGLNRLLSQGNEVVTDVSISDGVLAARALTFHTVATGLIHHQTEFWPDTYRAPEWRAAWVERY